MRACSRLRATCLAAIALAVLATPLAAAPIDYIIFDTDTLDELGSLTVDPALASPVGTSNVELSAFTITEVLGVYGPVTVTLADLVSASAPRAVFEDGLIQSLSANSVFELAGPLAVNVDITPETSADLSFVGIMQLFAFVPPDFDTTVFGPIRGIGIKLDSPATVPEPSTMTLFGLAAAAALRRRRTRAAA